MHEEDYSEVEEMFRDEARKHRQGARKTPNIPPGYYDNKSYYQDEHGSARLWELFEIRRQKNRQRKKGKK